MKQAVLNGLTLKQTALSGLTMKQTALNGLTMKQAVLNGLTLKQTVLNGLTMKQAVQCTQRQLIQEALQQHQQCWADAARSLGVDASNLHKLAQKLGLKANRGQL